jgi:hypothetical protein
LGAAGKGQWRPAAAAAATAKKKKGSKAAATTPAGRHSHTAVVWRDSMFVFGGATADPSGVPSGQLLEFNFRTPPHPTVLRACVR